MKPFHCQSCRHVLARSDGRRLVFGLDHAGEYLVLATIYRATAIECPHCEAITVWRPFVRAVTVEPSRQTESPRATMVVNEAVWSSGSSSGS